MFPLARSIQRYLTEGRGATACCPSIHFQVSGLGNREPGSGIRVQVQVRLAHNHRSQITGLPWSLVFCLEVGARLRRVRLSNFRTR